MCFWFKVKRIKYFRGTSFLLINTVTVSQLRIILLSYNFIKIYSIVILKVITMKYHLNKSISLHIYNEIKTNTYSNYMQSTYYIHYYALFFLYETFKTICVCVCI